MMSAGFAYPQVKLNGEYFDGCLGVYPFVERVAAKRSSRNRPVGTFETKAVNVSAQVYFEAMASKGGIMEQIQEKCRGLDVNEIVIQIDSAPPHLGGDNINKLNRLGATMDIPLKFKLQPTKSPESNLLDLSIWYSLNKQAEHLIGENRSINDIITNVTNAYNDYSTDKLLRIYSLYYVAMREILKALGGNEFTIPHTGIRKLQHASDGLATTEERFLDAKIYEGAVSALAEMKQQMSENNPIIYFMIFATNFITYFFCKHVT